MYVRSLLLLRSNATAHNKDVLDKVKKGGKGKKCKPPAKKAKPAPKSAAQIRPLMDRLAAKSNEKRRRNRGRG